MATTLTCPKCGTMLKLPPMFKARAARCSKCLGIVPVPREEDDIEEAELIEEAPAPRKLRLREEAAATTPSKKRPVIDRDQEDEPEDAPQPRRPRPVKRKRTASEGPSVGTILGVGLFVFAFWLLLAGLGYKFRPVSFVMLFVGAAFIWAGTQWLLSIASEESTAAYLMCLWVPFYDTWFALTRMRQTWAPCLVCWTGRIFGVTAIVLLVIHFFRTPPDMDSDGPSTSPRSAMTTANEINEEAEDLLRNTKTAEARAWLTEANKRRGFFKWGKEMPLKFTDEMYARGAVKVYVADIERDPLIGEVAEHIIVELPSDPEKRKQILAYINQAFRDEEARTDRGQKYEVLTED